MSVYAKGGYLDQKTRSPLSFGAAVAVSGAMVGALLFANPEMIPKPPTFIDTFNVPVDPPPPDPVTQPEPPKQKANQPQKPLEQMMTSDSPLQPADNGFTVLKLPDPPVGTGGLDGVGSVPIVPVHEPVFIGAQINPRFRDQLQPAYPPGKIRASEEGVVEVKVLIGADGRVKQVLRISATDDAFYRATEEQALRRWRFLPATRDGVAVESWQVKTVRFRLDQL